MPSQPDHTDEAIGDSTVHGWGFELSALLRDIELESKSEERLAAIASKVDSLMRERMEDDYDPHDPETHFIGMAMLDVLMALSQSCAPIVREIKELRKEVAKTRRQCHSPQ